MLVVTNTATESNIHSTLGYALVNPPAGMGIDANGVITWTPQQNQSPSTNLVTTVVTNSNPYDPVNPHLGATNTFTVIVNEVMPERPVIWSSGDRSQGTFRISVWTVSGWSYVLESADSLSGTDWLALGAVDGDGSVKVLTDPAATSQQRFYRVRVQ